MKTFISRRWTFSAAHTDEWCGKRIHGHDFWMEVRTEGPRPESWISVENLRSELHLRNLDEMIVGAHPNLEGMAIWILERLRPFFPGLRSVRVGNSEYEATVEV